MDAKFTEGYEALLKGDHRIARETFSPLAHAGHGDSQYLLGWMPYRGHGCPLNHTQAVKWFTFAAAQNNKRAMYYMGKICEKGGRDIDISIYDAFIWYSISALYCCEDAIIARDRVGKDLSDEEKKRAENAINGWMSLHTNWVKDSPKPAS